MTMAGLEVEGVDILTDPMAVFSVARIREARPHPNADKLRVCTVETRDGVKEIVCGAPNARAGLTTIYAPVGAFVPGTGITLEQKPVRGVISNGMLCSGAELLVDAEADGILDLPGSLPVGASFFRAFNRPEPASDAMIEIEVTPNRPDWLGVAGVARELAALGLGRLRKAKIAPVRGTFPCPIPIVIDDQGACPVFAGRLIRGVNNGASPEWLAALLRAAGQKPINALVDITNFMSLDRARPLHVYDADRLSGAIRARLGLAGERFRSLAGKEVGISPDMCVIADDRDVLGLGGVMGGESSGVTQATVNVFIESALFDPARIARTGRETGLFTDAQYRFARGVDPEFVVPGLEMATQLVLDLCGGTPSAIAMAGKADAPVLQRRAPVTFDPGRVAALTGMSVPPSAMKRVLAELGFSVKAVPGTRSGIWTVSPPSFRRDLEGPADVVEEILRIHGFDRLPAVPLRRPEGRPLPAVSPRESKARIARRVLAARGYAEAITWSFCAAADARAFGGGQAGLVLANPIAAELDCMRPSAFPNLIRALGRSADRGHPGEWLFEIGPVYRGDGEGDQGLSVCAVRQMKPRRHWRDGEMAGDLYDLKADLLAVLAELGMSEDALAWSAEAAPAFFHPGKFAMLSGNRPDTSTGSATRLEEILGMVGEIHPKILHLLGATQGAAWPVAGFELWLDRFPNVSANTGPPAGPAPGKARAPFIKHDLMPVRRDFAFILDEKIPAETVERTMRKADRALIRSVAVFDVYSGPEIGAGKRSLALEAILQPVGKTLTDQEIESVCRSVIDAVERDLGGVLRGA